MAWFKVDDGFAFHPKALEAGNAALGLWVRAGAWCGANLTDGALPKRMIGTLGAQARDARRLVEVGLWVENKDGYRFHEWEKMQPTKAEVEADRAHNRARQKAWRERQRNAVTDTVTNDGTNDAPTRPDPTHKEKPLSSGPADAEPRPDIDSLLDLLDERIEANGARIPSRTKRNHDAARLLLDRDGYTVEQVAWMIRWATADEFWRVNILSMSKLREKFEQLKAKATGAKQSAGMTMEDWRRAHQPTEREAEVNAWLEAHPDPTW
jgi:hypothetical protein